MKRHPYLLTYIAVAIIATFVAASAHAQEQVEYGATADHILNPDGNTAADGDAVLLGTWAPGFDFTANNTFSSLSAAFTQFDTTTLGTGGFVNTGQFIKDVVLTNPTFNGKQLYIWVFNNANPMNANAWAIVTNNTTAWTVPTTAGDFTAIDMSDNGAFVPPGALGVAVFNASNPGAGGVLSQNDWKMTMVPEPSTYMLLGMGAVGMLTLRRRLKR